MSTATPDLRGRMYRERRLMQPAETTEFLRRQREANVGTVDANGWPYVVPLVYIYEGVDVLYLHTSDHQGHFLTNVQNNGYALRSRKSGTCIAVNPTRVTLLWCTRAWLCLGRSAFCTVRNPGKRNSGFWISSWSSTVSPTGHSNLDIP
jgi:hypothetical protein